MNSPSGPRLMRDAVIETIYFAALKDSDIIFISADFGAKSLDQFRQHLPGQFIHAGISEQNMVDLSSGLALSGKTVFLYAMAPFITARCYEQIKCVLASMKLPVTLISVGVGLGYDHATLTHFTPEDIACMRAISGIEVLSPSDEYSAIAIFREAILRPGFRYVRLERQAQKVLYGKSVSINLPLGLTHLVEGKDIAILACGYMVHKALAAQKILLDNNISAGVIDLFRLKPVNTVHLSKVLAKYDAVLTVEEQLLEGGFGSIVLEALSDEKLVKRVERLGIKDGFEVVNGNRDSLHDLYQINVQNIVDTGIDLVGV